MPRFERSAIHGLYLIADVDFAAGRDLVGLTQQAIAGGASVVQLRQKSGGKRHMLELAEALLSICRRAGIPFIVNDHVDVALAVDADGVHVGQDDLPVAVVRRLLPPGKLIGCSTNNADEAIAARRDGADYVGVGSIFPTSSKEDTRPAGPETLEAVRAAVALPIVAIGGISADNIDRVVAAGADAAAVISAVLGAPDIQQAAGRLAAAFETRQPIG